MSEKRYFKIFSKKHILGNQNKYIHLFDQIDSQTIENDSALGEKLSQKGFASKYLSADKNYLYNLILRSLNEFYFEHNLSLTIKNNLQTIEILFHKGLYKECLKTVAQTEKLIKNGEHYTMMLELLIWKRKCAGYAYGLKRAQLVNDETEKYIEIVNNTKTIIDLYYKTYSERLAERTIKSESSESIFHNIVSHPVMQSEENALTVQAKIFFNLCYIHYYYFKNDFENEYKHHKRILEIIIENPFYQKENAIDCISLFNRLLSQSKYLSEEVFYKDLTYLDNFDASNSLTSSFATLINKQRILIHRSANELEHLFIKKKYMLAYDKIMLVSKGITNFPHPIEPYFKVQIFYLFAVIALSMGKFDEALDYTNTILNEFHPSENEHTYLLTQKLNILIHFDLENYITVEHLTKALLKKYKSQILKGSFEHNLLSAIAACCKGGAKPRHNMIANKLGAFIGQNPENTSSSIHLKHLHENYLLWAKSKIEKKLVCELGIRN